MDVVAASLVEMQMMQTQSSNSEELHKKIL